MSTPDLSLIPKSPSEVAKAIVYIALSAFGILVTALADNDLSLVEVLQTAVVVLGAIPVYLLAGNVAKTIVTFAVAALQAVLLLVADGAGLADVQLASWFGVIITAFAAIGVAVVPNKPTTGSVTSVYTYTPSK